MKQVQIFLKTSNGSNQLMTDDLDSVAAENETNDSVLEILQSQHYSNILKQVYASASSTFDPLSNYHATDVNIKAAKNPNNNNNNTSSLNQNQTKAKASLIKNSSSFTNKSSVSYRIKLIYVLVCMTIIFYYNS